jgi:predicted ATPase
MRRGNFYSDEMRVACAARFAAELAAILYDVGITHRELAQQLGVAHATVDSWTRVVNPTLPGEPNMLRLSELLEQQKPGAGARIRGAAGQRLHNEAQITSSPMTAVAGPNEAVNEKRATVAVEAQTHLQPEIAPTYPSNVLPALTQFVGRAREISKVRQLLERVRLLTLVGAGGIGKTRLALETVRGLGRYPDGVWLVELDALLDPELIPVTIAQVLPTVQQPGRLSGQTLAAHIGEKRLLLILDNCEHLVEACAQLSQKLLQMCTNISILATSREPLDCPGETVWRTQTLSTPQWQGSLQSLVDLAEANALCAAIAQSESGQLFLARACERQSSFELTAQNATYVAEICNKLDGLPLALELAAARISGMSVEEIAQRLNACLQLLTHSRRTRLPRQQALHASLQWSHDLLTQGEQMLFRRLGVFVGGWTLEAAEGVCAGDGLSTYGVFSNLMQLVDKSLVIAEQVSNTPHTGTRYRFLETIRQYALEQLADSLDAETFSQRHAHFFASLAEQASFYFAKGLWQPGKAQILAEIENVRAALTWTTSDSLSPTDKRTRKVSRADPVVEQERTNIGLHMVSLLYPFWGSCGEIMEGVRWTEKALAQSTASQRTSARAHALMTAVTLKMMGGQFTGVEESLAESESICREIGDKSGLAQTLRNLGIMLLDSGRLEPGRAALRESQALSEEDGNSFTHSHTLFVWGSHELEVGDLELAHSCLLRSLAICRESGDVEFGSVPLVTLARVAWVKGDYAVAQQLAEEALAIRQDLSAEWPIAGALNSLADIVRCRGDFAGAAALANRSLTIFRKLDDRSSTSWVLYTLGHITNLSGDFLQALEYWTESLSLAKDLEKHRDMVLCLAALAGGYYAVGQLSRSATLFGAADALLNKLIVRWSPFDDETYRRHRAEAKAAMTEEQFRLGWERGQAMQEAEAVAFALSRGRFAGKVTSCVVK